METSQYRLFFKVPPRRINEIIKSKRAMTVDTALHLVLCFDMSFFRFGMLFTN